jgi:hypothetical protein
LTQRICKMAAQKLGSLHQGEIGHKGAYHLYVTPIVAPCQLYVPHTWASINCHNIVFKHRNALVDHFVCVPTTESWM